MRGRMSAKVAEWRKYQENDRNQDITQYKLQVQRGKRREPQQRSERSQTVGITLRRESPWKRRW